MTTAINRNGRIVALVLGFGMCCGASATLLLAAPAVAARIMLSGAPALQPHLGQWTWMALASPLLALLLVRLVLARGGRLRGGRLRGGRLRGGSPPTGTVWKGLLKRAGFLLGAVNGVMFVQLSRVDSTRHDIEGMATFLLPTLVCLAVLVGITLWDGRPEPVTIEEVRASAAEVDRALRRVRTQNERVHRQAEQVRARVEKLRAHPGRIHQRGRARNHQDTGLADLDFHSLRTFHRESYQCADTAHLAYRSSEDSLRTMSPIVRRMRYVPQHWVPVSREAKLARAELRAAALSLAQAQGELRVQVERGLGMVRELNVNTSELKHQIRTDCGERGQHWFAALEMRIEDARASRG